MVFLYNTYKNYTKYFPDNTFAFHILQFSE